MEPIHITMDVNVGLEKELDDAFSQIDAKTTEIAKYHDINPEYQNV